MEATCKEKECSHWNKGKCPFSVETWWKPIEGQPRLVRDCAPIRTMLMVQELYNQQVRLQQALEEQRNQSLKVHHAFLKVVNAAVEKSTPGGGGTISIADNGGEGPDRRG